MPCPRQSQLLKRRIRRCTSSIPTVCAYSFPMSGTSVRGFHFAPAESRRVGSNRMIVRYSVVALTTADLARQRAFWVDQLGFEISEENPGEFFIVNAGGLRLCVDLADGDVHVAGGSHPVFVPKAESH